MAVQSKTKGIFCLEGDWWGDLKRPASVEPILRLLRESHSPSVPYIYRDVGVREELQFYLRRWVQRRHANYPILYLGFHGEPGNIHVGAGSRSKSCINLDWFEEELAGKCQGRVIHFGSCGTLGVHGHRVNRFLKRTGAKAVTGCRVDVPWMESTAFEIFVLSAFQKWALREPGLRAMDRHIREMAGPLARKLGFFIAT